MDEACGGRSDRAIQSEHCYQIPHLGEHRQRLLSTTGSRSSKISLILEALAIAGRSGPIDKSCGRIREGLGRGAPSFSLAFEARTVHSEVAACTSLEPPPFRG